MEVFGAEMYLQVQGGTHFGNVYAHADSQATIGFLKAETLQLLPFFDLNILKRDLEEKYAIDLSKMKSNAEKYFKKVVREINTDYERLFNR